MKDIKAIRAELKETTDPERQLRLRRLLQRLNDQHKHTKKSKIEKEIVEKNRKHIEQEFKEGKQPHFKNKCELIFLTILVRIMYVDYYQVDTCQCYELYVAD